MSPTRVSTWAMATRSCTGSLTCPSWSAPPTPGQAGEDGGAPCRVPPPAPSRAPPRALTAHVQGPAASLRVAGGKRGPHRGGGGPLHPPATPGAVFRGGGGPPAGGGAGGGGGGGGP